MADRSDDSLLREIDEEIRKERYELLWKKYGTYVIAGAILLVVGVAGVQTWKTWDLDARQGQTQALYNLTQTARANTSAALDQATQLAAESTGGPALLANLQKAALLSEQGDKVTAAQIYRSIADDSGTPEPYNGLAQIKAAMLEIDYQTPPADLRQRLAQLTGTDNPWRHIAKELMGLLALKNGESQSARTIFTELTEDATTPAGVRNRASQLLDSIGG